MADCRAAWWSPPVVDRGSDWRANLTIQISGVATPVTDPVAAVAQPGGVVVEITTVAEVDGSVTMTFTPTQSRALATGTWGWDLYGVVDGQRMKLVRGTMTVEGGWAEALT